MAAGEKPKKKGKQHRKPELEDDDDQRAMSRRKKKQKLHPVAAADQEEDDTVRADQDDEKGIKGKKKKKNHHQQQNHGDEQKNATITDARFVGAHSDPRFQRMPRHEFKVRIDSRFTRMFTDKSFARSSAPVDKRGKPHKGKPVNPLLHHYLHQDDDVHVDEAEENPVEVGAEIEFDDIRCDTEEHESSVGDDLSSLGSDDDDDVDDDDDDQGSVRSDIVQYLTANHKDTPMLDHATHRLAVVNMDWEHIKAVDIYVVMNSCLPKGGQILSVAIYPSEFGLKCMEVVAVHGPSALFCEDEEQSEDDSDIDNEKVRSYELNKLRYYYAVVVCDSSATANNIYKTLDGTELLKTSNVFDLRFVPDSMEFMHPPREIMTEAPTSYKEPDFQTRALQHSKVDLTWEKEEPNRKKMLGRKFNPNQGRPTTSSSTPGLQFSATTQWSPGTAPTLLQLADGEPMVPLGDGKVPPREGFSTMLDVAASTSIQLASAVEYLAGLSRKYQDVEDKSALVEKLRTSNVSLKASLSSTKDLLRQAEVRERNLLKEMKTEKENRINAEARLREAKEEMEACITDALTIKEQRDSIMTDFETLLTQARTAGVALPDFGGSDDFDAEEGGDAADEVVVDETTNPAAALVEAHLADSPPSL